MTLWTLEETEDKAKSPRAFMLVGDRWIGTQIDHFSPDPYFKDQEIFIETNSKRVSRSTLNRLTAARARGQNGQGVRDAFIICNRRGPDGRPLVGGAQKLFAPVYNSDPESPLVLESSSVDSISKFQKKGWVPITLKARNRAGQQVPWYYAKDKSGVSTLDENGKPVDTKGFDARNQTPQWFVYSPSKL